MDRSTLIAAMEATAAEKPIAVTVAKWGTIYVRQVTVAEVDEDQATDTEAAGDQPDGKKASKTRLARGACRVMCDETGARLFDPNNAEDVALVARQPWPLLRQVLAIGEPAAGKG